MSESTTDQSVPPSPDVDASAPEVIIIADRAWQVVSTFRCVNDDTGVWARQRVILARAREHASHMAMDWVVTNLLDDHPELHNDSTYRFSSTEYVYSYPDAMSRYKRRIENKMFAFNDGAPATPPHVAECGHDRWINTDHCAEMSCSNYVKKST